MKKLGTGMTAVSLAGHDTGKRYMIMKAEGEKSVQLKTRKRKK